MIDLAQTDIPPSEYSEFKELCNNLYRFVANEEHANLFRLMGEFPEKTYPRFNNALNILLNNSCLVNGSKGFRIGNPPEFKEEENEDSEERMADDKHLMRMEYVREVDERTYSLLSNQPFYTPACVVENAIDAMGKGTSKTILDAFFIKDVDISELERIYKAEAEKTILKFSQRFSIDKTDDGLFGQYNLSSNVFIYLFNRSVAYYRLFFLNFDPGYGDITERIFPLVESDTLEVSRTPNSEDTINLHERAMEYIKSYQACYGTNPKSFVSALLALINNISIKKSRVKEIYRQYSGTHESEFPSENEWIFIFDEFVEASGRVKYLSHDNIQAVRAILHDIKELNYGISVEKIFKTHEEDLRAYFIDTYEELQDFIRKYTTYKLYKGRVLIRGTLKEAVENFVGDIQVYDYNRLVNLYARRCGGPAKLVGPILKNLDMNLFVNENPLTEEEERTLVDRLSEYEWVTKENAKSIFSDLHNLEDKFTEINMHKLGFTPLQEIYYRSKYSSFTECILENEFTGEEIYVDSKKFQQKMDNRTFSMEVEYLERYLHWIPVSKYRYINLDSPRYKQFASILVQYRNRIIELCKQQFVTPYSLKNMTIGIPEIDDDDYDLAFYDAMLIASQANHQTLARHRFYFIPTDATSFNPTAPEFIRYLVYNNDGTASVAELQDILDSEYGIRADMSVIRNQIKLSTCIYNLQTDAAYLDDETYMEALRNESE